MSFEINRELIEYVLAPLISAQLFLTILIYFVIVKKRIAVNYKLYILFIITFIVYLIGRIVWASSNEIAAIIILYARVGLLMGIGIPSLLLATTKQSGIRNTKALYLIPYSFGILLSIVFILFFDAGTYEWFNTQEILGRVNIIGSLNLAHNTLAVGALILLILPCCLLIIKELSKKRQPKFLAFLFGTFLFGSSLLIGLFSEPQNSGFSYIGSIPCGIIWIWAVFQDIRDMKGKVTLLKEELQIVVHSSIGNKPDEINTLLNNLEELSRGNLEIYKMRIREILNMLLKQGVIYKI